MPCPHSLRPVRAKVWANGWLLLLPLQGAGAVHTLTQGVALGSELVGLSARTGPLTIGLWTLLGYSPRRVADYRDVDLLGAFSHGQKKRLGAEGRPAVNIRMYQELLHDNLLAVYDVKTVLSLCNATTAEVINNTVLLCRFDDFCIVDAIGECTSRNQTP